MNQTIRQFFRSWATAWDRFWFTPADPAMLSLLRILVGLMLVYTHLVWSFDLAVFFSESGVFDREYSNAFHRGSPFVWSHFYWFDSPAWMWGTHFVCLAILVLFTLGLWTRATSIISFLIVVSYANRASGALFGLDQINAFLTLYLAVGPCGALYSLDAWRKKQKDAGPAVTANIATRLIQIHLCTVYLFAGLGKLLGEAWWDGTALWGAFASYDYQTIDMTFLANSPWLVNLMTHMALAWEVSYAFLIWPRLTRPIMVVLSVPVHLGIGMCMGMMTFGWIMIFANLAFVAPCYARQFVGFITRRSSPLEAGAN